MLRKIFFFTISDRDINFQSGTLRSKFRKFVSLLLWNNGGRSVPFWKIISLCSYCPKIIFHSDLESLSLEEFLATIQFL